MSSSALNERLSRIADALRWGGSTPPPVSPPVAAPRALPPPLAAARGRVEAARREEISALVSGALARREEEDKEEDGDAEGHVSALELLALEEEEERDEGVTFAPSSPPTDPFAVHLSAVPHSGSGPVWDEETDLSELTAVSDPDVSGDAQSSGGHGDEPGMETEEEEELMLPRPRSAVKPFPQIVQPPFRVKTAKAAPAQYFEGRGDGARPVSQHEAAEMLGPVPHPSVVAPARPQSTSPRTRRARPAAEPTTPDAGARSPRTAPLVTMTPGRVQPGRAPPRSSKAPQVREWIVRDATPTESIGVQTAVHVACGSAADEGEHGEAAAAASDSGQVAVLLAEVAALERKLAHANVHHAEALAEQGAALEDERRRNVDLRAKVLLLTDESDMAPVFAKYEDEIARLERDLDAVAATATAAPSRNASLLDRSTDRSAASSPGTRRRSASRSSAATSVTAATSSAAGGRLTTRAKLDRAEAEIAELRQTVSGLKRKDRQAAVLQTYLDEASAKLSASNRELARTQAKLREASKKTNLSATISSEMSAEAHALKQNRDALRDRWATTVAGELGTVGQLVERLAARTDEVERIASGLVDASRADLSDLERQQRDAVASLSSHATVSEMSTPVADALARLRKLTAGNVRVTTAADRLERAIAQELHRVMRKRREIAAREDELVAIIAHFRELTAHDRTELIHHVADVVERADSFGRVLADDL